MKMFRLSKERGHADHGWLKSAHTFSFANYYDPNFMGFRSLRVINEDHVAAGGGFPTHPHNNMEIITYMVSGELEHQDTLGNKARIVPGEIQRMSAGTGIRHSEYNPSQSKDAHLLQIWLLPKSEGIAPSYGQKSFKSEIDAGKLTLLTSQDGKEDSVAIHQDVNLWAGKINGGTLDLPLASDRFGWLQLISGEMEVDGEKITAGDAVAIAQEKSPQVVIKQPAHFLFFDLA